MEAEAVHLPGVVVCGVVVSAGGADGVAVAGGAGVIGAGVVGDAGAGVLTGAESVVGLGISSAFLHPARAANITAAANSILRIDIAVLFHR